MSIRLKNIFLIFVTSLLLYSCAFNKLFLQPTKIPASTQKLKMKSDTDSMSVIFSGNDHQPEFPQKISDSLGYIIESVQFKSTNGDTLNAWWLKPKNMKPTVTLLHMHGNADCLLSQYQAMSPLAEKGFQIFMFDYSGFGFSQGKATRKNVLTDALAALDFVKQSSAIKDTKLVIYGQSLGGHLAAVVASQRQNDIDGLVMEGAFSSHKDIGAHMVPVLGKIFVKQGYSALKSIKDYHKPLLVIHSTEDQTIPFYMGKKIYEQANQPKTFYEVQKCHICAPNFYAAEIIEKIKAMLK